jgi:hypothetical protein
MSATECAARHNEEIHQTAPMQHRDQAKITYRSAWAWMREWDTGIETTVPGYVSTDSASEHAWAAGRGRERHLVVPRATPHCPLEVQLVLVIQRSNRWRDRVRQLISSLEVQPVPYARWRWAAAALLASGSRPESGERHKCSRGKLSKRPLSYWAWGFLAETALNYWLWCTRPTRLLNQRWPVLLFPRPVFRHRRRRLWMGVRPDASSTTSAWATAGHLPCQDSRSGDVVVASLPPPGLATCQGLVTEEEGRGAWPEARKVADRAQQDGGFPVGCGLELLQD